MYYLKEPSRPLTCFCLHLGTKNAKQSLFSLSTSERRGCAGGDWCEVRGRAGEGLDLPRGRASHTSRLPRVDRWLEEKKETALQSTGDAIN